MGAGEAKSGLTASPPSVRSFIRLEFSFPWRWAFPKDKPYDILGIPEGCDLKQFSWSYPEESGQPNHFLFKVLTNGTAIAKLTQFGPYHLHLCANRPPESNSLRIRILLTDERVPSGKEGRQTELWSVGPVSAIDLDRWKKWLRDNVGALGAMAAKALQSGMKVRSLGQLLLEGWQPMPDLSGATKVKDDKAVIHISASELLKTISVPVPTPKMLTKPNPAEAVCDDGIALLVGVGNPAQLVNGTIAEMEDLAARQDAEAWVQELASNYRAWLVRETEAARPGPLYLAMDGQALMELLGAAIQWALDGAIASFDDPFWKEWFASIKEAVATAREGRPVNWAEVLRFDTAAIIRVGTWKEAASQASPAQATTVGVN